MYGKLKDFLTQELANIKAAGLYKNERIITTPQKRRGIREADGGRNGTLRTALWRRVQHEQHDL